MDGSKLAKGGWAWAALLVFTGLAACEPPTSFEGSAKFPGGVVGCRNQCSARGLEMGSFIYIGAYSTACACRPSASAASIAAADDGQAAAAAAVAGVELQRRRLERQAVQSGVVGGVMAPALNK